jgi:hypothetical protein
MLRARDCLVDRGDIEDLAASASDAPSPDGLRQQKKDHGAVLITRSNPLVSVSATPGATEARAIDQNVRRSQMVIGWLEGGREARFVLDV